MRTLLWQLLRLLERLLPVVRTFCGSDTAWRPASPCVSCLKTDCTEICEHLKAHLNGPYEGKLHGETTGGVDFDEIRALRGSPEGADGDGKARKDDRGTFREFKKVESFDAIEPYRPCWDLLSHKQQEAVQLYHGEHKGLTEIAEILGILPSSVHGRLKRARDIKDGHREQMRREELDLLRELKAKWREY